MECFGLHRQLCRFALGFKVIFVATAHPAARKLPATLSRSWPNTQHPISTCCNFIQPFVPPDYLSASVIPKDSTPRNPLSTFQRYHLSAFSSNLPMETKMEIDLQPVEEIDFTNSERAIFNVLKATLQYPANPQIKGLKIADDIDFFCKSAEGEGAVSAILWDVWGVIVEIVSRIPPGNPWQTSLVQSLDTLRRREGSASPHNDVRYKCYMIVI